MLTLVLFMLLQSPQPEFGWKVIQQKTVSLSAGDMRVMRVDTRALRSSEKIRVEIDATSAVSFGIGSAEVLPDGSVKSAPRYAGERLVCAEQNVFESGAECELDTSRTFALFVADQRTSRGSAAAALFGLATHNGAMLERTTKPNKAKITVYRWERINPASSETK